MSGREVDVGGEGPILQYIHAKLESKFLTSLVPMWPGYEASFLPVKTSSFHHAKVWSSKTQ